MTEKEEIEEMRKEIENGFRKADCKQPYTNEPYPYFETQKTAIAKALYDAGYRKEHILKKTKLLKFFQGDIFKWGEKEYVLLDIINGGYLCLAKDVINDIDKMIKELVK